MAIRTGDVIFKCRPYAHVLKIRELKIRCHFCLTRSDNLVTCSGCQRLKYCSSECQESDWKVHCLECKCIQNMKPDCPSDMTRLMLRLVIKIQTGDHHKMFEENKIFQRTFTDLMSHYDDLQRDGIYYDEAEITRCAKNCLDLPSHETLQEIFGKVITNSFTIPDERLVVVGTGIYLSTSILNHSCAPNAIVITDGTEQTIYALSDIPEVAPDKVFISYIDMCFTSWQRRDPLLERFYFYCQCSWCEDDAHYIDHIMTSALCPISECPGFTGMTRDKDGFYKILPCTNCGQKEFSQNYEQMVKNIWNYGNECCDKLENLQKNRDFECVLSFAEKVLREFDESILYESNVLYIRVREFAIGACMELGLWAKAAEYGEKVLPQKKKCIPHADYTAGCLMVELGKFYLKDHNIPEARRVSHNAKNVVIDSHGFSSDIHKEILDILDQCDEVETVITSGILDANNNSGVKHVFNHIKHNIRKVLPRSFRIQSLFGSKYSKTTIRLKQNVI